MLDKILKEKFQISDETMSLARKAEDIVLPQFKEIDEICACNQAKVLKAFADFQVSEAHLGTTTGYGYDDLGRDTLDKIYAQVFGAEDALVRHTMISGTHALSTALFAVLRPGDVLLAATGKPYDTLEEVIGIRGETGRGSLADFGVRYLQVDLKDEKPDFAAIKQVLLAQPVKMVCLQRSRGYDWRNSFSPEELGEIISFIKSISPNTVCFVDNCYGEFCSFLEPTHFGADLMAGSLIKNPGGGLAKTGGYIAGRHDLVELCGYRLSTVGTGRECGCSLGQNRDMYQGFFLAPHVVAQAQKAAVFASCACELAGFEVSPRYAEKRSDIIQAVRFGDPKKLVAFCQAIQAGSPVDAYVTPEPWDMPGYADQVIMAAGAFTQGASIELSCDGRFGRRTLHTFRAA